MMMETNMGGERMSFLRHVKLKTWSITQIFLRIQHIKWGVLQRDSMLWAVELQMGRAVTRALGA